MNYDFQDLDFDHVALPREDENNVNIITNEIYRLTIACKDQEMFCIYVMIRRPISRRISST